MESTLGGMEEDSNVTAVEFMVSCENLACLIRRYRDAAAGPYQGNPEALSAMHLTIMELWTALDASATSLVPLLHQYSPGIPAGFFDGLILPRPGQLERLARVEDHLAQRRAAAGSNGPPWQVRSGDGSWSSTCFAVRYYEESCQHQQLHRDILHAAKDQLARDRADAGAANRVGRLAKIKIQDMTSRGLAQVLRNVGVARDKYAAAKEEQVGKDALSGEDEKAWEAAEVGEGAEGAKARVLRMRSAFFLWPLPQNETAAKAFVFETQVPAVVAVWREATLNILAGFWRNEAHNKDSESPMRWALCGDHPIVKQLARPAGDGKRRFQLAVPVTDDVATQFQHITADSRLREPFCIKFIAEDWTFYDTSLSPSSDPPTLRQCLSRLERQQQCYPPTTVPLILQSFILSTTHTSNEVLAAQPKRPENMTPDEFRAFGSLRAGRRLQWHNILLQFAMPSIDLNRPEAFFLIMQAANEAGPRGYGALRSTHAILGEQRFGDTLLLALEDTLSRAARRRESEILLGTLVSLAVKLLSVSPYQAVQERCLDYLRRLRCETANRARHLAEQLRSCDEVDEKRRARLKEEVYMLSLICHNTFDVGTVHAPSLLSDSEDSALLIEASIRAAEHTPSWRPGSPTAPLLDIFSHRWRRLSYEMESQLKHIIVTRGRPCLDMAIQRVWASYKGGEGWSAAPVPQGHVLTCDLAATATRDTLSLQYNLLTGSLLVNRSPFSALPASFRRHATYRRVFGTYEFAVISSYRASQGMQYMATSIYQGHELHFAMFDGGSRLVVQSEKDGTSYELIPPERLKGDLPSTLIEGYVHWLVPSLRRIELRPLNMAWKTLEGAASSAGEYYVLDLPGGAAAARLTRLGSTVVAVDIRSETANVMHAILRPLESPHFIGIAYDKTHSTISIILQRLGLAFSLASGTATIASEQYKGYEVDPDQALGTLSGLESKLVLVRRPYGEVVGQLADRLVLIPVGEVSFGAGGANPTTTTTTNTIVTSTSGRVQHHAFPVDTTLGCLRDSGAVGAKLLLCHLHAVTTYCLPDRLTGRTGTDEALRILRSAPVQSANQLQKADIDRLCQISLISPTWSVSGSQKAALSWNSTTPWAAQDSTLGELARAILNKSPFTPTSSSLVEKDAVALVRRRAARTSTYLVSQYGVLEQPPRVARRHVEDTEYSSLPDEHSRELKVWHLTRHMAGGKEQMTLLHPVHQRCRFLATCATILAPSSMPQLRAKFHAGWIEVPWKVPIETWCEVLQEIDAMRRSEQPEKHVYKLIFFLAGLIFAPQADLELVQILLAVATEPIMQRSKTFGSWRLRTRAGDALLRDLAAAAECDLGAERERDLAKKRALAGEAAAGERRLGGHSDSFPSVAFRDSKHAENRAVEHASHHRALSEPQRIALEQVIERLAADQRRRAFARAIRHIQVCFTALAAYISELPINHVGPEPYLVSRTFLEEPTGPRGFLCLQDMFSQPAPPARRGLPETFPYEHPAPAVPGERVPLALPRLLKDLKNIAQDGHEQSYVQELRQGLDLLDGSASATSPGWELFPLPTPPPPPPPPPSPPAERDGDGSLRSRLLEHLEACRRSAADMFAVICDALSSTATPPSGSGIHGCTPPEHPTPLLPMPSLAVRLPAITPVMLLERLSRSHRTKLSREWLRCLCDYAVSLTALQRAERMVRAVNDDKVLARELQNVGHENWDPIEFPDWLLLEVEMGILIRPVQRLVASAMMNPPGAQNHVMQLNVGQGKSSVVIPMVAAALADGSRLVRVVVAKPQSKQMLHTLTRALGGLLGRHVHTLPPFSRGFKMHDLHGSRDLADLHAKWKACRKDGGVLVAQPEHILSLRLSGLEAALPDAAGSGTTNQYRKDGLLQLQYFLDGNARDIIDESDEILNTKSELAYTMGVQTPIDLGQQRWHMIQGILGITANVAAAMGLKHSDHLEIVPAQSGRFPFIRILDDHGADILTKELIKRILGGALAGFTHVASLEDPVREAVLRYITHPKLEAGDIAIVQSSFATEELQGQLFLLRGLIAHQVLCSALQKRWRVNYGRANGRNPSTGLAVPFRAKDSPTPRSDFSHPDLVLVLTYLTYYYGGLHDDELFRVIQRLLLSVDGEHVYQGWVQSAPNKIPLALRQLAAINITDHKYCVTAVFPHLRYLQAAINYYLSKLVFAREMREFPKKLSESAWSLAAARAHPVTGFSGTKDTKYILPETIKFLDLDEQRHTNALALSCLLGPENTVQCVPAAERPLRPGDAPSPALQLLHYVVGSAVPIRVIIDAGAQMLELDNAETARRWLAMVPEASAAAFFNSDDDICVVVRDGTVKPFWASPYATSMVSCLVYLDEAHTRGTDLRFPSNHRAVVTLGPGLTKDRLIQGGNLSCPLLCPTLIPPTSRPFLFLLLREDFFSPSIPPFWKHMANDL